MTGRPAQISPEAKAWLADAANPDAEDLSTLAVTDLRARARAEAQTGIDMVLAETNVLCEQIDVSGIPCLSILPPDVSPGRVMLYAFGGGFTLGSPEEDIPISARLSVATRSRVIAPYYRLAPEHPFPAALDDVSAVAQDLLAGPERVMFAGESAGATLLLASVHRLRAAGGAVPDAMALMSPATDQGCWGDSLETDRDPTLAPERVLEVASVYAPGQDLTDPEISPIFGSFDKDFPPVIVTTGTRDLFLSQSVRLAQAMRDANAEIDIRVWEGMWHVFEFYPNLPEAKASIIEMAKFLNDRL